MYYSGRSSWSDVGSIHVQGRERLKIVTTSGKTYKVKPPYTVSDVGITLNTSDKPTLISKSEIAQVYDIVVEPLTANQGSWSRCAGSWMARLGVPKAPESGLLGQTDRDPGEFRKRCTQYSQACSGGVSFFSRLSSNMQWQVGRSVPLLMICSIEGRSLPDGNFRTGWDIGFRAGVGL